MVEVLSALSDNTSTNFTSILGSIFYEVEMVEVAEISFG
jgi:hypothetical protein